ncbi:hypothetical protein PUN28_016493 [Cardiocondyla obscurior]|uniref:Replication factor A protein 3 n=1 Tax=Cardiocondyla obscurior TaxID=286306 RepID=A0AAW2ER83_9HYME
MSDLRVLGKRLGQRIGQEAIVVGRITEKSSDGMSAEVTTTDDARINVTFLEPLENVSGYIEVRGTVKSKSTMSCNKYVCISTDITNNFDTNSYNTMVNIRCAVGNELQDAFCSD